MHWRKTSLQSTVGNRKQMSFKFRIKIMLLESRYLCGKFHDDGSTHRDVFEDNMVKAKARGLRGRGQGQIILDQGLYNPAWLVRLHRWFLEEVYIYLIPSKVLRKQTNSVKHCNILMMHCATSYGHISKPRPRIVEAEARGLRGQGHKILSSRSRPVLEDPIPVSTTESSFAKWCPLLLKSNKIHLLAGVRRGRRWR